MYGDKVNISKIRKIIDEAEDGYQIPGIIHQLFDAAGIPRVKELVAKTEQEAVLAATEIGFPLAMKVIGPLHKSDVGGVVLNIRNIETVKKEFHHLFDIKGTTAVLLAQMAKGNELFLGAKYEPGFGHVVVCGMGGIYVEVMKDIASGLAPLSVEDATSMIKSLKSYKILKGYRGQKGLILKFLLK